MRFFPGAKLTTVAASLLLAGCTGSESLPDDPRPAASAEIVVPPAAVNAWIAPAESASTAVAHVLPPPGPVPHAKP